MGEGKDSFTGVCFEEALGKLEVIVKELESGDLPLEEALAKFEEGVKLSRCCFARLEKAEKMVDTLVSEINGVVTVQPLKEGES